MRDADIAQMEGFYKRLRKDAMNEEFEDPKKQSEKMRMMQDKNTEKLSHLQYLPGFAEKVFKTEQIEWDMKNPEVVIERDEISILRLRDKNYDHHEFKLCIIYLSTLTTVEILAASGRMVARADVDEFLKYIEEQKQ